MRQQHPQRLLFIEADMWDPFRCADLRHVDAVDFRAVHPIRIRNAQLKTVKSSADLEANRLDTDAKNENALLKEELKKLKQQMKDEQDARRAAIATDKKEGVLRDSIMELLAVTRCSGGDGGVDGGDDDDDDDDDVQLDDGDGVDFPLREGISPADSCPPESSFLSGVSPPRRGGSQFSLPGA
ncbi:hypothetical protein QYE76_066663 [Lolium multiflorum]|uniref:Uncharacterized protein n=1 Tax=Lolium multiflorum TaxID=4521 RepID=A0AAD8WA50_LOLMU|nr:hypothetical protein QYE76_066663 [Lolium multiflorum]